MNKEELEKENEELKKRVETLRKKLRAANRRLAAFGNEAARAYRDQEDYVPYAEDDRRE
jgi:chaperonin cofactor prefoldin